jgi:hypothetical protein
VQTDGGVRDADPDTPNLTLTRDPPWVAEGRSTDQRGSSAVASETNALGVTVTAWGAQEKADQYVRHASEISGSLAPMP